MTITASAPNATDWLALANDLASDFATRAADHDAERHLRRRELRQAARGEVLLRPGAGRARRRRRDLRGELRDHPHVARGCGSTALAYSMHSHLLQGLIWRHRHGAVPPAEPLLRRIAKDELILVSTGGSDWLDGSGTLTKENGSYTFKARKIFGSGSPSGDLLLTTGIYDDPEKGPTVLHFGVDMHDPGVKVLDNWRTMGMRATGSNDIVIDGVTVQDAAVSVRRPKGKWHQFFNVVSPLIFPLVASAYVGVAEAAREIAVAQAAKRRDDPIVQSLIGEMDTELLVAQAALDDMVALASTRLHTRCRECRPHLQAQDDHLARDRPRRLPRDGDGRRRLVLPRARTRAVHPRHPGRPLPPVSRAAPVPVQRPHRPGTRSRLTENVCAVCGRVARYAFPAASGDYEPRCLRHAIFHPRVRDRALGVGLVVGTILFAINQLDAVLRGELTLVLAAKVALTYLVPYCVSTYSALQASRRT